MLLNARSVCNKATVISEHVQDEDAAIVLLTETEPDDTAIINELTPPGYTLQCVGRKGEKGGGLEILHKQTLDFSIVMQHVKFTTFEHIQLELKKQGCT